VLFQPPVRRAGSDREHLRRPIRPRRTAASR
jgi:hypothetical protein